MADRVLAEKLQLCPEVAAKWRGLWQAVCRALKGALAWVPLWCSHGALAAQPATPEPRALVVTSTLEPIAAAPEASGGDLRLTSDTVASHADQLILSVRFTNTSGQVLDGVRITSPVPPHVQYVAGTASGPGSDVLFSADDGRTFGRPEELTVAAVDGGTRAAIAADYTHVRWVLRAPLGAGATGVARYRAVPR